MYLMTSIADLFFFFFFNDTATTEIYTLSLHDALPILQAQHFDIGDHEAAAFDGRRELRQGRDVAAREDVALYPWIVEVDRKSTRLNSSHSQISYAVFCLKKKKNKRATDYLSRSQRNAD